MKKETTATRLKKVMQLLNLRQTDIIELAQPYCRKFNVRLNKSDLSQYVSGKVEPGQEKLSVIGMATGVSEAWLLGYDVPMERDLSKNNASEFNKKDILSKRLFSEFGKLNTSGKNEAINRVTELTYIPRYTKKRYIPTEEDMKSLVARNGKKMSKEEAMEFISDLFSDDEDD